MLLVRGRKTGAGEFIKTGKLLVALTVALGPWLGRTQRGLGPFRESPVIADWNGLNSNQPNADTTKRRVWVEESLERRKLLINTYE